MNPEVQEFGVFNMMFYYVSVALFLAIITVLDDGLELAMGVHIATNVYGSLMVSYEGSVLQTPAIFKMLVPHVGLMTIVFFVSALVFYILANRKYQIGRWWKLNQTIESKSEPTDLLNVGWLSNKIKHLSNVPHPFNVEVLTLTKISKESYFIQINIHDSINNGSNYSSVLF